MNTPTLTPEQTERARQALADEKAAYAARRAPPSCDKCLGTGRALIVIRDRDGVPFGRTSPCPACRPEDEQRLVAQLRAG